ncbi:MAG: glycoside hydrolase family 140 protein [Bacteroidota bacterium]|nr:glycoside hydrolase family 140 protein [Bacteroidota bacterium]
MKYLLIILSLLSFTIQAQFKSQRLKVSDNKRFLVYEDGTPFFYLGDTGWELFHRLDREQAERYLKKRSEQGFTVIQAVAIAEENGLKDPNPYGEVPLIDLDPTKPNEKYFQHVDYIIDLAAKYGIFIALLPTWGDKVDKMQWGQGPEIFNHENIRSYGKWIGNRYKDKTNIIWVNGGDREPKPAHIFIWRALAEGIIEGVGNKDKALISFHPPGGTGSSNWLHKEEWLDFNMLQTGHCRDVDVYTRIAKDYNLIPTKPTMDAEPIYEDHPVCFDAKTHGYSTDTDLRKSAYWGVFAGGHGHTYGCHDVWQMFSPDKLPVNNPRRPWYDALDMIGANQMKHLKNLILSRPFLSRIPDQSMVVGENKTGPEYVVATRDQRGSYAMVYIPVGKKVSIDLSKLSGSTLKVFWYNPKDGTVTIASDISKKAVQDFTPATLGKGNDWVLIIDDASKGFKAVGAN